MKFVSSLVSFVSILTLVSCASINSTQKQELNEWQAKNLQVEEKKPGLAAGLNVLPGIGDFYNGNVGYGILNLLSWPLSVLWAPVGGADGAREVNYFATKAHVEKLEVKKKKLKTDVETHFVAGQITKKEYLLATKKIDNMELIEFQKDVLVSDIVKISLDEPETTDREPSSKSN